MQYARQEIDQRNWINGLSNEEFLKRVSSIRINEEQKKTYFNQSPNLRQLRASLCNQKGHAGAVEDFGNVVEPTVLYPRNFPTGLELEHPSTFDEREIVDHIDLLSKPGGWVFDPFLGSGATLTACFKTGRKGAGIELMPRWVELAKKKIEVATGSPYAKGRHNLHIAEGDCLAVMDTIQPGFFDFIITSPPYFNIMKPGTGIRARNRRREGLATDFGNHQRELGSIENYGAFTKEINRIYSGLYRVLKPGRFMVLVVADISPKGKFVPFHVDTILSGLAAGFDLVGIQVVFDYWKKNQDYGIPRKFFLNFHHHYALVFQKKDSQALH